jgi:hypothetical protein
LSTGSAEAWVSPADTETAGRLASISATKVSIVLGVSFLPC